jgi:hypothetical protein
VLWKWREWHVNEQVRTHPWEDFKGHRKQSNMRRL